MSIISDSDENSSISTEEDRDEEGIPFTDEDGEEEDDSEEQAMAELEEEIRQYLPPPRALELADNPLLHMSPTVSCNYLIIRSAYTLQLYQELTVINWN